MGRKKTVGVFVGCCLICCFMRNAVGRYQRACNDILVSVKGKSLSNVVGEESGKGIELLGQQGE